ncbi:Zinc finger BED domain-containing protein DAYSLEEPER [Linum perenne]
MVSMDCQTRWNSTFLMLDTAVTFEPVFTVLDAIDPTFKEDLLARKTSSGVPIGTPTPEDWKLVRNLTKFLKFFNRMTLMASGQKYCTVHLFIGELTRLYNHIRKAVAGSDQHVANVAWNMRHKKLQLLTLVIHHHLNLEMHPSLLLLPSFVPLLISLSNKLQLLSPQNFQCQLFVMMRMRTPMRMRTRMKMIMIVNLVWTGQKMMVEAFMVADATCGFSLEFRLLCDV